MIGQTVGHYQIIDKLGAGGMGEVFLATDTRLERKAAIKFMPTDMAADTGRRQRFIKEARAASALNHPHVCVVYDVGETEEGVPFIAMEFVEGQPLDEVVRDGPLEISRVVEIAVQVADALDAAHQSRIVHRDIKPANICLNERGQVKVLDFGLAKRLPEISSGENDTTLNTMDSEQTQEGKVMGTPSYMSPEQTLGKEIDHRTDIFSMGVVLYKLSTGELPFNAPNFAGIIEKITHAQPIAIARLNYDVPPELERIVLKCLQKSPDRRYQSSRELMIDLQNIARDLEQDGLERSSSFNAPPAVHAAPPIPNAVAPEPFSIDKLKSSDVLLNYAAIDDQPLLDGKAGWVSQLHQNLQVRVEQLSGQKVNIARLPTDLSIPTIEDAVLEQLPKAKAMISVISPPFIRSDSCMKEVQQFWTGVNEADGLWVDDKARLLKVLKTAVSSQEMPPTLADIFSPLFGFEFFEMDASTGRVREFDETFGPAMKQRFFERVYDLAYDLCHILKTMAHINLQENIDTAENPNRQWIYLATTTSDLQDERDRIRRELLERGHSVLPEGPLPMLSREVESIVRDCLEKCTISIHLLGRHYGVTPEDSSESIPALQVRITAERSKQNDLQRMIWMSGQNNDAEERQQAFIHRVQEDPALHHRAEIIEGNLNLLKKDLIRRLEPPEEKSKAPVSTKLTGGAPKVYLICDPRDEALIESLEDYLFDQGMEVCLPAFDGDDAEAAELHQDNLLTCDAILVYYASAPKAWVDIKLRESLKVAGYGRETPIQVQAVYIAPPDDRRKERFRSHQAEIIRQEKDFTPSAELDAFIGQTREACA